MKVRTVVAAAVVAAFLSQTSPLWAQVYSFGADEGVGRKQCLTDEAKETIKKLKALNRRLTKDDPDLPFDPDYFVGTWNIEWDAPESAMTQAGTIEGTFTVKHVEGCYYEGQIEVPAPEKYSAKVQLLYDAQSKYLTWIETDSRGFVLLKPGPIGGDGGGYFTHYFEPPAIRYKGKTIRLRGSTFLASPVNFRVRQQISTDGEPFMNFGNPWFTKRGGAPTAPKR